MEINVYLLIVLAAITLCIIRLLRPNVSVYERLFLIILIVVLSYAIWDKQTQYKLSIVKTAERVSNVIDMVRKHSSDVGMKHLELTLPIQKVLESDPVMLKTILALMKFAHIDKDAVYNIISNLIMFYELYADILMEVKDVAVGLPRLIDLRFKLMNQARGMFVSMPQTKNLKVFEYISMILQSSTYKCLNVLKNKYGVNDYEPPVANNSTESSFELY